MQQLPFATLEELEKRYPPSDSADLRAGIRAELADRNIKIVVLDDDPTGVQTVHGCTLYTSWETDVLREGLEAEKPMFYVLTNSRSLDPQAAGEIYRTISNRLRMLADEVGVNLIAVSRSDSTLRGHFAEEVEAMTQALLSDGKRGAVPFVQVMFEAGRYTLHAEHMVDTGESLVKAQDTEFAEDREFGYPSSHIPTYVRNKIGVKEGDIAIKTYDVDELRAESIYTIAARITDDRAADFICPDALAYIDLEKFALALIRSTRKTGRNTVVCRSSSSFPRALSGQEPIPLLRGNDLIPSNPAAPGIVFVGSHVNKTTLQLEHLLAQDFTRGVEISTERIHRGGHTTGEYTTAIEDIVSKGLLPVVYTARKGVFLDNASDNLALSRTISDALVDIFSKLFTRPSFVISKGGITSHDLLTRGAGVKKALVKGAILPGVPVLWIGNTDPQPFIIFPGNVGSVESVTQAAELLGSGGNTWSD